MLSRIQYLVEGFFESSAVAFKRTGLSPNLITVLGFTLTLLTAISYYSGLTLGVTWFASVVLLFLAGYFDALDGAMARRYLQTSKIGGILDSILDRVGEITLYAGLGLGGLVDLRLCFWALSAALMVSYARARVEVEGVKLKGIGIAERPERLIILLLATILLPLERESLTWGVSLVAILSTLTVVERVYRAFRLLSRQRVGSG